MKPRTLLVPLILAFPAAASGAVVIPTYLDGASSPNAFNSATNTVNGSGLSGTLSNGDSLATALALTHVFDGGFAQSYVSNANGADYFVAGVPPVIVFDLGSDTALSDVVLWQYQNTGGGGTVAGNAARTIELRFNTAAQGTGAFAGPSTDLTLFPVHDGDGISGNDLGGTNSAQSFAISATGRYVQLTLTDNFRDFQGITGGGDRVGFGEIAFNAVPEPSIALLGGLGFLGILRRRR